MKGKKTGGRKPGVPNKITQEVRAFALTFLNNPKGLAKLEEQYEQGTLPPAILSLLFHYGAGKPKETIEHLTPMRPLVIDRLLPGEGQKADDDSGDE